MREILFRGKLKYSDDWVYGDLFHLEGDCTQIFARDDPHAWRNDVVDPNTVGQFTGLLDKYGTKIFEGDIIKLDDRLCQVTWLDGNAQFDLRFIRDFGDIRIINFKGCEMRELYRYEVIGNIHDNPELLKGGAE